MIPQVADTKITRGSGPPIQLHAPSSFGPHQEGEAPQESQEVATASPSIKYRLCEGKTVYRIELQDERGGVGGWELPIRDGDQIILNSRAASWIQAMARVLEWMETMEERRK
jgi:hypothetical protein